MKKQLFILGLPLALVACSPAAEETTETTSETNTTQEIAEIETSPSEDTMTQQEMGSIVDVASQNGNFETLLAAAQAAGLAETLDTGGPFTVFAPTDEAFAKLPEGTVESLLEQPEELAKILQYHVVEGEVDASTVTTLDSATTILGQDVAIDTTNGVMINDATVVQADVMASNGIIHVIDTVLMPE